jgi:catechol 2,3-dioxygenase-like lactoylglutathione lyase family enzyme
MGTSEDVGTSAFTIGRIDHIKVCVPDRQAAARWYDEVFGLRILQGPAWAAAAAMPDGPLFLGIDDAVDGTKVALFAGEPQGTHPPVGMTRTAFSVGAEPFLRFLDRLGALPLFNEAGERLTLGHLVDQWIAWSLYFNDPYGNRYELVTYEYEVVKQRVEAAPQP